MLCLLFFAGHCTPCGDDSFVNTTAPLNILGPGLLYLDWTSELLCQTDMDMAQTPSWLRCSTLPWTPYGWLCPMARTTLTSQCFQHLSCIGYAIQFTLSSPHFCINSSVHFLIFFHVFTCLPPPLILMNDEDIIFCVPRKM